MKKKSVKELVKRQTWTDLANHDKGGTPTEALERKKIILYSGVLKYFPCALKEVAKVSFQGSNQLHPGQPVHWDKSKSSDHADALMRHLVDYAGGIERDTDGQLHLGKICWRSLALLEQELEKNK